MRAESPASRSLRAGDAVASRRRRGFTLIEVIVALAVFALGATMLAAAYVNVLNAIDSVKSDQALEQEIVLVRSQVLQETDLEEVEEGGDLPTAQLGEATWRAEVTPSEEIADLFRIELEISFRGTDAQPEERTISQTLWVLRPEWSEPSERDALRARTRERLAELKRGRSL